MTDQGEGESYAAWQQGQAEDERLAYLEAEGAQEQAENEARNDQLTDQQLADWLAEFMGWHKSKAEAGNTWYTSDGKWVEASHNWHPTNDINQAMMLLPHLSEMQKEGVLAILHRGMGDRAIKAGEFLFRPDLARALCQAVKEAVNESD